MRVRDTGIEVALSQIEREFQPPYVLRQSGVLACEPVRATCRVLQLPFVQFVRTGK
ncbi:hypothetical protein B1M_08242 [Burkholderia sp. TJI49]|nr:hypothetical protein B1M_08242 [Burkholderia sp. TJI49]